MNNPAFRGKYNYTIDAKGRVNVPSKFRRAISPLAQNTMVVTRGTEGCLFVYPLDAWERFEAKLQRLPLTQKNSSFRRFLLDSFSDSVVDKQGRISLTPEQVELAGIEKDVLILGDIEKIQIWNPVRYVSRMNKDMDGVSYDEYFYGALQGLDAAEDDTSRRE